MAFGARQLAKLEEEVKRLAAIEKALLAWPDKQISLTDCARWKPDFVYLAKDGAYRCPAGEKLAHHFSPDEDGQKMRIYLTKACRTAQGSVHNG